VTHDLTDRNKKALKLLPLYQKEMMLGMEMKEEERDKKTHKKQEIIIEERDRVCIEKLKCLLLWDNF
jgi:hypothetical protein